MHMQENALKLMPLINIDLQVLPLPCLPSFLPLPLTMQADLEQQKQQVEQLQHEVDGLKKKVTELSSAVHDGAASRAEVESSLDKTLKERNHWQQKSVQQDMVLQTTRQVHVYTYTRTTCTC